MAPDVRRGVRRLLAVLFAAGLLAACGGAGADPDDVEAGPGTESTGDPDDGSAPSTGSADGSTTTVAGATPPVTVAPWPDDASGLTLLPTTSTTMLDVMVDPPMPVVDPAGPPGANSVFVMGDSVFLGTTSAIPVALPEWLVTYDAVGNRRLAQGIDVLVARRPQIGGAVVIHLGNNFIEGERGSYATQIDEAMAVLDGVPRVVWVTVSEVSDSRRTINEAIRDAATRWPNLRVADWAPIIAAAPELSWDGLHLTPAGRRQMATLIAETLGPLTPG